ncbi:MAG: fasciclin domain-containing protein, partial [Euryarchaeota archaeon]
MSQMKTLFVCMILIALPATQVSADVDETNPTPEVTIGFGNVTNDTMVFTMDTSVDVYVYQIELTWETGAVYCGISGSGGLSEDHNLYVSVLYAGCLTTGYYYGAQGTYYIPSGSNDTLTSIYYQSNSPEVCIGNATYAVMLSDGEFEYRQADFDPNDCLTYTMYEQEWPYDVWYVLDDEVIDDEEPQSNGDPISNYSDDVIIGFNMSVDSQRLAISVDTSVNIHEFRLNVYGADCGGSFTTTGLAADNGFYITFPQGNNACEVHAFVYGSQGSGTTSNFIPAGSSGDLIAMFYEALSEEICIVHASYLSEVGGEWQNARLTPNYCLSYSYYDYTWYLDSDQTDLEIDEYGISERDSVLWAFQNSPYFSTLMLALEMTNLTESLQPENTPQMGYTVFAPTNDAFNLSGINLDDFNSSQGIALLTEILLYHVTFAGPFALDSSTANTNCQPYTIDWMPMLNGEYADPLDYSSWTETVEISNDCLGNITVEQANVIDADNRVYGYEYNGLYGYPFNNQLPYGWQIAEDNGMIQVIDQVLIPSSLNLSQLPTSSPRFNPENDVPTVLQDDGSFDILISALNLTGLLNSTREGNSPNMGFTMIAPTDEAFQDFGLDLDEIDTQEEIDILTEILLHHTTIHPGGYTSTVVWFDDENCTGVDYELNVGNGEYAEPGNYSSWT